MPYTLADRDRLNRVEVRLEALEDKVDILRQDMKDLRNEVREDIKSLRRDMFQLFLWGFGLLLVTIMGLVGFMVRDRRSFMVKIEKRVTLLEQKKIVQPVAK